MAAWYAPLVLPPPLAPLPNKYQDKIPHFTGEDTTTAQQHVSRISDAFEYMEVHDETVRMRIFAQSLGGEPKTWFKSLPPNSIHNILELCQVFTNKWKVRRNPIQILSEYNNLKRENGESVQAYCTRFNNVYNALPPHFKPPLGLILENFPEGFDPDMTYHLRDKDPPTLEEMQQIAIKT